MLDVYLFSLLSLHRYVHTLFLFASQSYEAYTRTLEAYPASDEPKYAPIAGKFETPF